MPKLNIPMLIKMGCIVKPAASPPLPNLAFKKKYMERLRAGLTVRGTPRKTAMREQQKALLK